MAIGNARAVIEGSQASGTWIELKHRWKEGKTIDRETHKNVCNKTQHRNNVLQRIILIVQYSTQWNFFGTGKIVKKVLLLT